MECGKVMLRYNTPRVAACNVWEVNRQEIKSTFRGVQPFGGMSNAKLEMICSTEKEKLVSGHIEMK